MHARKRLCIRDDQNVESVVYVTDEDLRNLREWIGNFSKQALPLEALPDDLIVMILKRLPLNGVGRLACTCKRIRQLCMVPCVRRLALHTSNVLPRPSKFSRSEWHGDMSLLSGVFCDARLQDLVSLTLLLDSPTLASMRATSTNDVLDRLTHKVTHFSRLSIATLPNLRTARIVCDPRVCCAPSAPLMRRLLPFFCHVRSLSFENMHNVGVSHFAGLYRCASLTSISFNNCRASPPLCDQRRLLDGSMLRNISSLRSVTLDFLNAAFSYRLLADSGRAILDHCKTFNLRSLSIPRHVVPSVQSMDRMLSTHKELRQITCNRRCAGLLEDMLESHMHHEKIASLRVTIY